MNKDLTPGQIDKLLKFENQIIMQAVKWVEKDQRLAALLGLKIMHGVNALLQGLLTIPQFMEQYAITHDEKELFEKILDLK